MADNDFKAFYKELFKRDLEEPTSEEDVKNVLSCINVQHGVLDSEDEHQLKATSSILQRKMNMIASHSRKGLAKFTKT